MTLRWVALVLSGSMPVTTRIYCSPVGFPDNSFLQHLIAIETKGHLDTGRPAPLRRFLPRFSAQGA
jgi:hypothetical protein